jgi:hypothetical protein
MQLVAYGAQDIYLTGNPQITFFKVVYRRHTNFSMESIAQTFNGSADFGRKVTCTVSRNGDLINRMYLEATRPVLAAGDEYHAMAGHSLIKSVEIEIGGQRIDKHYGDWLHIWNELTQTEGHWKGYKKMVSTKLSSSSGLPTHEGGLVTVPLQFWFCRNPGLALPLIALQYHEVKINIEFSKLSDCSILLSDTTEASAQLTNAQLYVDYVYLDTDERRRFAQVSHEYLIEQLQFTGDESAQASIKLNFNHPVKELVWVEKQAESGNAKTFISTYTDAQIQLNSHERFSSRHSSYFQLVQPYQHHERVPIDTCINVYSFALKPEEHQPSGTCNMSRIDNATLKLNSIQSSSSADNDNVYTESVKIFAVNYNVLRIMSGMGGLAYSN